jgi:hypothetical protein
MATIADIKSGIGIPVLNLQRNMTKTGEKTEWLSHWDNDKRVRVNIHESTLQFAKENPDNNQFDIQTEDRISVETNLPYKSYRIVKYSTEIEDTL